jgi:hypothetical protein
LAEKESVSINQLITLALAEKLFAPNVAIERNLNAPWRQFLKCSPKFTTAFRIKELQPEGKRQSNKNGRVTSVEWTEAEKTA